MKGTSRVTWPEPGQTNASKPASAADHSSRTFDLGRLALLDERVERKVRGYNPYDAQTARPAAGDVWRRKPKRD